MNMRSLPVVGLIGLMSLTHAPYVRATNYWFDVNQGDAGYGMMESGFYDWLGGGSWNSSSDGGAGAYATWPNASPTSDNNGIVNHLGPGTSFTLILGPSDDQVVHIGSLGLNWNLITNAALGSGDVTIGVVGGSGKLVTAAAAQLGAAAGTLTINSALAFGSNSYGVTFRGGNVIVNGQISDGNSASPAGTPFAFAAGNGLTNGTLTLTHEANTFTGRFSTMNANYTLAATKLANGGQPSSIGTSTNFLWFNAGTLKFIGMGAQSTDLGVGIASGGAFLDASGPTTNDTIGFSGPMTDSGVSRYLTLTGTNTGDNTFGSILANGPATQAQLNKKGVGTWALTNQNTHTGGTIINAGLLKLTGGDNRLSTAGWIRVVGGTLDLGGNTQSTTNWVQFFGGATRNGTLDVSGGYDGRGGVVSAVLAGSAPMITRDGTFTLSATNAYTGYTAVNSGWLDVSGLLGGGSYSAPITNNGRLVFSGPAEQTLSGVISGAGSLYRRGTGTLFLPVANTYSNLTHIEGGTIRVENPQGLGNGQSVYIWNSTLDLRADSSVTFGPNGGTQRYNLLGRTGGGMASFPTVNVDRVSAGHVDNVITVGRIDYVDNNNFTWTFTGANGYSLAAGAVRVAANRCTALAPTTANIAIGQVYGASGVGGTSWLGLDGTGHGAITDVISNGTNGGVLAVTKTNSSTWTLHGNNTYTGTTTINGGSLIIDGAHTGGGAMTVNGGALLLEGSLSILSAIDVFTGGLLGGSGHAAGPVRIQPGGALDPGLSGNLAIEALTLQSDSVLKCRATATSNNKVTVSGILHLPQIMEVQVSAIDCELERPLVLIDYAEGQCIGGVDLSGWVVSGDGGAWVCQNDTARKRVVLVPAQGGPVFFVK